MFSANRITNLRGAKPPFSVPSITEPRHRRGWTGPFRSPVEQSDGAACEQALRAAQTPLCPFQPLKQLWIKFHISSLPCAPRESVRGAEMQGAEPPTPLLPPPWPRGTSGESAQGRAGPGGGGKCGFGKSRKPQVVLPLLHFQISVLMG